MGKGEFLAFTTEHVAHLTGLSMRQLRYWDATEFYAPASGPKHARQPFGRVYSFRDVVALRTLAILRNDHGVPL